jgi:hypothetical protein
MSKIVRTEELRPVAKPLAEEPATLLQVAEMPRLGSQSHRATSDQVAPNVLLVDQAHERINRFLAEPEHPLRTIRPKPPF